jgi:hypothetical protein
VSKLPYDNESKDRFTAVKYNLLTALETDLENEYIQDMRFADESLTSYMAIAGDGRRYTIGLDELDGYRTGTGHMQANDIVVVDITRGDYGKIDLIDRGANVTSSGVECLGIMPVLVSPVNAMFYQRIISSETEYDPDIGIERTPKLSAYQPVADAMTESGLRFSQVDK